MRKATKFIITLQTQYCENYGAHAWDGEGECPQYWKNKGGSEYVATTLTINEALDSDYVKQVAQDYTPYVEHSSDYSSEHVISWNIESEQDFKARHAQEAKEYKEWGYGEYRMPTTVDQHLEQQAEMREEWAQMQQAS
jgi:hypothetical protein